jgi:hypothetical protein
VEMRRKLAPAAQHISLIYGAEVNQKIGCTKVEMTEPQLSTRDRKYRNVEIRNRSFEKSSEIIEGELVDDEALRNTK